MHSIKFAGLLLASFWLGTLISPFCSKSEINDKHITSEAPLVFQSKEAPKNSQSKEKNSHSNDSSICVIGRSSTAHIPTALSAFSFSLLSTKYPNILQFIIGCEFANNDEQLLRDTVASINELANEAPRVFVVNRNKAARESLLLPKVNDFCYIETDLLVDRLLKAQTDTLTTGTLAWPALAEHSLPRQGSSPLCDFILFSNTDNLYGQHIFTNLMTHIKKGHRLIGFDFVSHHPKVARQVAGGRTGTFVQASAGFVDAGIDLGAALVSAELLRKSDELRFVIHALRKWKAEEPAERPSQSQMQLALHDADGRLFQKLAALEDANPVVEHKVFLLHQ